MGTNVHLEQMKDMLLTYNEYNRDLGYVQGMSDLLAPIYAVMQDDAIAFWGFVGFMKRMVWNDVGHVYSSPANDDEGAQLPPRPVGYEGPAPHSRSSRSAHGPRALCASPIGRLDQFLLFLPHVARMVQARI